MRFSLIIKVILSSEVMFTSMFGRKCGLWKIKNTLKETDRSKLRCKWLLHEIGTIDFQNLHMEMHTPSQLHTIWNKVFFISIIWEFCRPISIWAIIQLHRQGCKTDIGCVYRSKFWYKEVDELYIIASLLLHSTL